MLEISSETLSELNGATTPSAIQGNLDYIAHIYQKLEENVRAIKAEGDALYGTLVSDRNGGGYDYYWFIPQGVTKKKQWVYVSKGNYSRIAGDVARGDRIQELTRLAMAELEAQSKILENVFRKVG